MEKIIYANGTADVLVPAGQKIAIATYGNEYATLSFKRGNNLEFIQRLDNAQVTLGPWGDARTVSIEAAQDQVSYDVATNPSIASDVRVNINTLTGGNDIVAGGSTLKLPAGNLDLTGGGGGSGSGLVTGRTITAADNAQATDAGKIVVANSASSVAFTLLNDTGLAVAVDTVIAVYQAGVGVASFAAGSGVTLRVPASYAASAQYDTIFARKVANNEWVVAK